VTAVTLRTDTHVTCHGFVGGRANSITGTRSAVVTNPATGASTQASVQVDPA
jgi:hypothetical protein